MKNIPKEANILESLLEQVNQIIEGREYLKAKIQDDDIVLVLDSEDDVPLHTQGRTIKEIIHEVILTTRFIDYFMLG